MEERENDTQQRAIGWNRTRGDCSKDTASVRGVPALQLGYQGSPAVLFLYRTLIYQVN